MGRAFALAAAAEEEFLFDDADPDTPDETRQIKAFRIRFASGFEVIALSSAPRSLRGKQGVVCIDEAAFVESLAELLKAALAFLMWGGQVIVVSTHNGRDNPFNQLVQDCLTGRKPYAHLRVDFDDALKDGLYQRICLVTGKTWTPEAEAAWRAEIIAFYAEGADEELFCVPSESAGAWLPGPLIEARMTAECPLLRFELPADYLHRSTFDQLLLTAPMLGQVDRALAGLDRSRRHAFGFDFGRVGDLSVAWVLAIDQHLNRHTVLVVEMRRFPHREQEAIVGAILKKMPRPCGASFDAGGEGNGVAEEMQRLFGICDRDGNGGGLVEAVKLSPEWYRTEMPPLKAAFEDGSLTIPRDAEHRDDFRLVAIIRGIPQIPDVRTGAKGKKRHADAAIALAMAYHASRLGLVVDVVVHSLGERASVSALDGFDGFAAEASDEARVDLSDFTRF